MQIMGLSFGVSIFQHQKLQNKHRNCQNVLNRENEYQCTNLSLDNEDHRKATNFKYQHLVYVIDLKFKVKVTW